MFLLIENALEGKIWLNQIWFGYYTVLAKTMSKLLFDIILIYYTQTYIRRHSPSAEAIGIISPGKACAIPAYTCT
jgi:hypothetical protein